MAVAPIAIVFTVKDADDNTGISGLVVSFRTSSSATNVTTDSDGKVTPSIVPGAYTIAIQGTAIYGGIDISGVIASGIGDSDQNVEPTVVKLKKKNVVLRVLVSDRNSGAAVSGLGLTVVQLLNTLTGTTDTAGLVSFDLTVGGVSPTIQMILKVAANTLGYPEDEISLTPQALANPVSLRLSKP